jgi:hypothetical protein
MFTGAVSDLNSVVNLADIMFSCKLCDTAFANTKNLVVMSLKFKLKLSCLVIISAFSTTWFMLKLTSNVL